MVDFKRGVFWFHFGLTGLQGDAKEQPKMKDRNHLNICKQSIFQVISLFLLVFLISCAPGSEQPVACTMDARICPDGSAVGRVGPNCEFAPCPMPVQSSECAIDTDCACGVSRQTGDCLVGPAELVDTSKQCPDFCTGIAGHLETKCLSGKCQTAPRQGWNEPVACTEEAKICPDGSSVERTDPNCEFASCPESTDLSSAHWLCEDGSWKQNPEQCFENSCLDKSDCQILGVSGVCGPYKVAAPKTVHKAPVFYEQKCGAEQCSVLMASCIDPLQQPVMRNVDCMQGRCVAQMDPPQKECDTAVDCAPSTCCHATTCGPLFAKPSCEGVMCTMNCAPGTLDCGGSCGCVEGRCVGVLSGE
ncbi:hypothetical protein J4219_06500 [Candidatus Woesearchaeota archaeon]|nr:hypothetical protein [Candidatus Woesearchaeota archaeon]